MTHVGLWSVMMNWACLLDLPVTTNLFTYIFIYLWLSRLFTENETVMEQVLPVTCHAHTHTHGGGELTQTALLILLTSALDGIVAHRRALADLPSGTQPRYRL